MQKENICPAGTARVDKEILFLLVFCFFCRNLTFGSGVVDFYVFSLQVVTLELCLSGSQEIATIKLSSSSPMCTDP